MVNSPPDLTLAYPGWGVMCGVFFCDLFGETPPPSNPNWLRRYYSDKCYDDAFTKVVNTDYIDSLIFE